MTTRHIRSALLMTLALPGALAAQDRLKNMPGYEQYTRMAPQIAGSVKSGQVNGQWVDGGKGFEYAWDGKRFRFDAATRKVAEVTIVPSLMRVVSRARPASVIQASLGPGSPSPPMARKWSLRKKAP